MMLMEPLAAPRALLLGLALVLLAAQAATAGPLDDALQPAPALAPDEVVRIQIEALRHNDAADRGIAVCFRFASPANKAVTGPLARFAAMIRAGAYAPMLGSRDALYGPVRIHGDVAVQRVTLVGEGGVHAYLFRLSRQGAGDCPGCWMTDAVAQAPPLGQQAAFATGRGMSGRG